MKKKFSFAIIFFIAGVAVAGVISVRAFQEAFRSRKIQNEVEALKQDAQRVQKENEALKARIAYLQTPEFQEKIAKEKLNLQKQDENIVVIKTSPTDDQSAAAAPVLEKPVEDSRTNYQKWWDFFFKYS